MQEMPDKGFAQVKWQLSFASYGLGQRLLCAVILVLPLWVLVVLVWQ